MTVDEAGAPARSRVRTASAVVGELLITLGVVALLLVVYQVWWTGVQSAQAIAAGRDDIVKGWSLPPGTDGATLTSTTVPTIGTGFALLYIPRLRDKVWQLPISEGVGLDVLARGAGHYPGTALPGGLGNFAIAAHRATHDEPFRDIDRLQVGDTVYVQTRSSWYTYVLRRDQIVLPTDTWVIDPVPGRPGAAPTQHLITLTTCNPRWASYERWIWWGDLTATSPAAPAAVTGTV